MVSLSGSFVGENCTRDWLESPDLSKFFCTFKILSSKAFSDVLCNYTIFKTLQDCLKMPWPPQACSPVSCLPVCDACFFMLVSDKLLLAAFGTVNTDMCLGHISLWVHSNTK